MGEKWEFLAYREGICISKNLRAIEYLLLLGVCAYFSHMFLEYDYGSTYSEHLFIPPQVTIHNNFSALLLLLKDRQAPYSLLSECEELL